MSPRKRAEPENSAQLRLIAQLAGTDGDPTEPPPDTDTQRKPAIDPEQDERNKITLRLANEDVLYRKLAEAIQAASDRNYYLRLAGVPDSDPNQLQMLLRGLVSIKNQAEYLSQIIASVSIKANRISRVQAAKILGVHQATVARWVNGDGINLSNKPTPVLDNQEVRGA